MLSESNLKYYPDNYREQNNKGPVAEWLGKALQKLLQRFESARDLWYHLQNCAKTCKWSICRFLIFDLSAMLATMKDFLQKEYKTKNFSLQKVNMDFLELYFQ